VHVDRPTGNGAGMEQKTPVSVGSPFFACMGCFFFRPIFGACFPVLG